MKHCQWCDTQFKTEISYQIYCSEKCRNSATREKVAERYAITRREKRMHKKRKCKSCGEPLSAYNDDALCSACVVNPSEVSKALKEIKGLTNET
jgi:hypothetical protein